MATFGQGISIRSSSSLTATNQGLFSCALDEYAKVTIHSISAGGTIYDAISSAIYYSSATAVQGNITFIIGNGPYVNVTGTAVISYVVFKNT